MWIVTLEMLSFRFCLVLDDLRDQKAWDIIKCALIENSNGSAILILTGDAAAVGFVNDSYELQPLSPTESSNLFWKKLSGYGINYHPHLADISKKFLKTCGEISSTITDTVELLRSKALTVKDWTAVFDKIVFLTLPPI